MPPLKLKPKLKQYNSATPPTKGFRQGRFLVPGFKTLKLKLKLKLPYQHTKESFLVPGFKTLKLKLKLKLVSRF